MAKCSGINLLTKEELNPFLTSTYGFGQAILHAIDSGIKSITVGIGGSATNDGGSGLLEALGCRFFDRNKKELFNMCGGKLDLVQTIDATVLFETIKEVRFTVLSDVTNPLLKEKGASFLFMPNKKAPKKKNYRFLMRRWQIMPVFWNPI